MIEDFWNEFNEGDVHVRDNLQFELKSEFSINLHLKKNIYKQEVYFFIPNPLQINAETYSKQNFYEDQTILIRYKTPSMEFSQLIDYNYSLSPLTRLYQIFDKRDSKLIASSATDELKLFGAIFRSSVREHIYHIATQLEKPNKNDKISNEITLLCTQVSAVCEKFRELEEIVRQQENDVQIIRHFRYVDEFISTAIGELFVVLLKEYNSNGSIEETAVKEMKKLILHEENYRRKHNLGPKTSKGSLEANESILYRNGLLHRFILESLILKHTSFSPQEKHRNILGAFAAGFAMLVYMIIFVWQISPFINNAFPFVALAVIFYILKDRLKEGFKTFYSKQAHRWFPDFSTVIMSFKGYKVGKLAESVAFIDPSQLPEGFLKIRNQFFHEELQAMQRHESIIQYKRELILNSPSQITPQRRSEVTTLFRFNVHRFLQKASNAFQTNLTLDSETQKIIERLLPKVYHLNMIIRNSFLQEDGTSKVEIRTFRVVIDKNGIKRVEQIKTQTAVQR